MKNRLLACILFASFFLSEAFGEETPLTSNEKSTIVECFKRLKRKVTVQAGEVSLVDAISQVTPLERCYQLILSRDLSD